MLKNSNQRKSQHRECMTELNKYVNINSTSSMQIFIHQSSKIISRKVTNEKIFPESVYH